MKEGWYTERWKRDGKKAESHVIPETFDDVRQALHETLAADQILRVRAPLDADKNDIDELLQWGAKRI